MEQQEQSSTHSRFGQSESNFSFQTSNMALKNADIARELEPRSSRSLSINQNETINSEAILKRIRCKKNNLTAIDNYFCEENCSKNKTNNVGGEEFFDLRCSSLQIEELQKSRQLQQQRRRSSAGYPGLAFGSPMFSNTLFKFSLIANELKDLKQNQLRKAESEVSSLNRRILMIEDNLEKTEERLRITVLKLEEAQQAADESERIRKTLENKTNMEDDRISFLESQLAQARQIAEESDKKYEEYLKTLGSC